MRTAVLPVFASLALLTSVQAQPPRERRFTPGRDPVAKRLVSEPFEIVEHLRDIDPAVLRKLKAGSHGRKIADRGGKFNATDVVEDDSLPFERLMFAGHVPGGWFILYEQGGIGFSHHLVVFTKQPDGKWKIVAAPYSLGAEDADFQHLKTALRQGKYRFLPGEPVH